MSLWDAGIDHVNDPEDRVPSKLLRVAESALGLENPRRQTRIDYWLKRTGLTRDAFVEQLAVIGVSITPNVRTLPKGGLRRVRRRFDSVPVAKEKLAVRTDDCPPFKWVDIGVRRSLTFLTDDDLRGIHDAPRRGFCSNGGSHFSARRQISESCQLRGPPSANLHGKRIQVSDS